MRSEQKESVYDRIRREVREKNEQEKERQRRLDQWSKQEDPQTLQDLWANKGGDR